MVFLVTTSGKIQIPNIINGANAVITIIKLLSPKKFSKRITDQVSDKLTHYLRFKSDAILISSKTLNIDNPKLNCRLNGYNKFSPKRIILDSNLKIDLKSYIVRSITRGNTIIFYNSNNIKKKKTLEKNLNLPF